jgi:digeranylgeranylglycerophospholipid reductase
LASRLYDVIIVGAGPAGSYAAYKLASSGYSVAVFERKSELGVNGCCTGIISTDCFRSLGLETDVILARASSVKFFSPSGRCLRLQSAKVQAYIVDRLLLDKAIASKARSRGAQYFLSSPVIDIIPRKDGIDVKALYSGTSETFGARALVLANGFNPRLPRRLGLGKIENFLVGAQAEIQARNIDETEVYFGQEIAPGSFAWVVPISADRAYVGLLATSRPKLHLQKFLHSLSSQGRITTQDAQIRQKAIPVGTLARSYGNRLLVIGDAAGQAKPTSGGGIYFGHLGAQIAAEVLGEALRSDNLTAGHLSHYQKRCKAKMGKELSRGYWARWAYARLSDRQIERIFNVFDSSGTAEALLNSSSSSFDWHSQVILAGLRHSPAYPLLKIKHLFSREAKL